MSRTHKRFQILSWNVNGIRAAHRKGFLDWLNTSRPDVLCLQETKIQHEQVPAELIAPMGYHSEWTYAEKKGYSGVATYSLRKPVSTKAGFGEKRFDSEGRVLISDFGEFVILNIYFPNGQRDHARLTYKMDFYDKTLKICEALKKKGKRIVISGDVNTAHRPIDLERPEANAKTSGFLPIERKWIDDLLAAGYVDTFRLLHPEPKQYTWWDMKSRARERNIGWRLDYHFVSSNLKEHVGDAFILADVYGSDHCPAGVVLEF